MAEYQLTKNENIVIRTEDGASIPADPENRDWIEYQTWLDDGGAPDPYEPDASAKPAAAKAKAKPKVKR